MVAAGFPFPDHHRTAYCKRPNLTGSHFLISDHMTAFVKKLNQVFITVILIPVYFIAVGMAFLLQKISQKKADTAETYWNQSKKLEKASYSSSY